VFLVLATTLTVAQVKATYDGRQHRTEARMPQPPGGLTAFFWYHTSTNLDLWPVDVIWFEPAESGAAPPPGLDAWPEPGEAAVSPGLAGHEAWVEERYGPVRQTITAEGLASPSEKLVYFRPASPAPVSEANGWAASPGFGTSRAWLFGEISYVMKWTWLAWFALAFVGLPSVVLLVTGVRGAVSRDRRTAAVAEVLGLSPRRILAARLRSLAPAAGGGVLAAGTLAVIGCFANISLPVVGYRLYGPDLRGRLPYVGLAFLAGLFVVAACMVIAAWPANPAGGTRPRARQPRYPTWVAVPVLMGLWTAGWQGSRAAAAGADSLVFWFNLGMVLALVGAAPVCGWALRLLSALLARRGRQRGDAALLVAGRQGLFAPSAGGRLAGVVALAVAVAAQASLFALILGSGVAEEERLFATVDGHFATVGFSEERIDDGSAAEALKSTSSGVSYVVVGSADASDPSSRVLETNLLIVGDKAALERLGLEPGAGPASPPATGVFSTMLTTLGDGQLTVVAEVTDRPVEVAARLARTARPDGPPGEVKALVFPADPDARLDLGFIQGAYNRAAGPGMSVETPASGWRVGGHVDAAHARWLLLFGLAGGLVTLLATWTNAGAATGQQAARIAPLGAVAGAPWTFYLRATLPATVGASLVGATWGFGSSWVLLTMLRFQPGGAETAATTRICLTLTVAAVVAGIAAWQFAARAGARAAEDWTPAAGRQEGD
jgi:hypothetical protein